MGLNFENLEGFALSFMRSNKNSSHHWNTKIVQIVQETFQEVLNEHFNATAHWGRTKRSAGSQTRNLFDIAASAIGKLNSRVRRSLSYDDLQTLMSSMASASVQNTSVSVDLYTNGFVFKHSTLTFNVETLRSNLKTWLNGKFDDLLGKFLSGNPLFGSLLIDDGNQKLTTPLGKILHISRINGICVQGILQASLDLIASVWSQSLTVKTKSNFRSTMFEHTRLFAYDRAVDIITVDEAAAYADWDLTHEGGSTVTGNLYAPSAAKARSVAMLHMHPVSAGTNPLVGSADIDGNAYIGCSRNIPSMFGLEACIQISEKNSNYIPTEGLTSAMSHAWSLTQKASLDQHHFMLSFKNSDLNSLFLDARLSWSEDNSPGVQALVGITGTEDGADCRLTLRAKNLQISTHGSLVNAANLKRVELQNSVSGVAIGFKAELMMVRDGGLTTYMPRFVFSNSMDREQNFLEGYATTYYNDKEKSLNIQLKTLGTLQKYYLDLELAGEFNLITPLHGSQGLVVNGFKIVHRNKFVPNEYPPGSFHSNIDTNLLSRSFEAKVDGSITMLRKGVDIVFQASFNGEPAAFGAHFYFIRGNDDDHSLLLHYNVDHDHHNHRYVNYHHNDRYGDYGARRVISKRWADSVSGNHGLSSSLLLYFEMPNNRSYDSKLSLNCSVQYNQVLNNVSIWWGEPGPGRLEYHGRHTVNWRFLTIADETIEREDLTYSRLFLLVFFPHKNKLKITNSLTLRSLPVKDSTEINHSLLISRRSIRNLVQARINHASHRLIANIYDRSSEHRFNYHVEAQMITPSWRFSYSNNLVQLSSPSWRTYSLDGTPKPPKLDILGQSELHLPSGARYITSARFNLALTPNERNSSNIAPPFIFEAVYDTRRTHWEDICHTVFQNNVQFTGPDFSTVTSLTVDEITAFETSFVVHGIRDPNSFGAAFRTLFNGTLETELIATKEKENVELSGIFLFVPANREVKGSVSLSLESSGGQGTCAAAWDGRRDVSQAARGKVAWQLQGTSLNLSTTLTVIGSEWGGVLNIGLGKSPSDQQIVQLLLELPDLSRLSVLSSLKLHLTAENIVFQSNNKIDLPSGDVHQLSIDGSGHQGVASPLHDITLDVYLTSPFTSIVTLGVACHSELPEAHILTTTTDISALSDALYWEPLVVTSVLVRKGMKVVYMGAENNTVGQHWRVNVNSGERSFSIETVAEYLDHSSNTTVDAFLEIKRSDSEMNAQLRGQFWGCHVKRISLSPRRVLHELSLEVDHSPILKTEGHVDISPLGVSTGRLNVTNNVPFYLEHVYIMEAKYAEEKFEVLIAGKLNDTAVLKTRLTYKDLESLNILSRYSGGLDKLPTPVSLVLNTSIHGIGFGFSEDRFMNRSVRTSGTLRMNGEETPTRIRLIIEEAPGTSHALLRISSVAGHRMKVNISSTHYGLHQWGTTVNFHHGFRHFMTHHSMHRPAVWNFTVRSVFHAPHLDYHHIRALLATHPQDNGLHTLALLSNENETLQHIKLHYTLTEEEHSLALNATAEQITLNRRNYDPCTINYNITTAPDLKMVSSAVSVGNLSMMSVSARATDNSCVMSLRACATQCISLTTEGHSSPDRSISIILESLDHAVDDETLTKYSFDFMALMKDLDGQVRVSSGLNRFSCIERAVCRDNERDKLGLAFDFLPDESKGELLLLMGTRQMKVRSQLFKYRRIIQQNNVPSLSATRHNSTLLVVTPDVPGNTLSPQYARDHLPPSTSSYLLDDAVLLKVSLNTYGYGETLCILKRFYTRYVYYI